MGLGCGAAAAQVRRLSGAAGLKQQLERLRVVGSVLMIAAHPDDENTALLAYCAQGRKLRTGYLSLTRGEGGQNLIGSEQGDLLGLLRTQELLAARRVDGAEQFFTRAIDFGFSKTAGETLQKWGREQVLGDVVWVIRKFRPDVIILRFSGTPRDGHGHHQSSAILGKEAFRAAADPNRFPEQLKSVKPWQAKRIMWNGFSFTRQQEQELEKTPARVVVDTGEYDPVLGSSYGELAGLSRSQHRSQGFGSAERRGSAPNYLFTVDGDPAKVDFLEAVDVSWNRVPGGVAVDALLKDAIASYRIDAPERIIPLLNEARKKIAAIDNPDARRKVEEIDEAILMASGLWLDVSVNRAQATPGSEIALALTAVARGKARSRLAGVVLEGMQGAPSFEAADLAPNKPHTANAKFRLPADQPCTMPFWLREPKQGVLYGIKNQEDIGRANGEAALKARFRVEVEGGAIEITRPVEHRYVDRVRGELTRPFVVVPPVSLRLDAAAPLFPEARAKTIGVIARATAGPATGRLTLDAPAGWKVEPQSVPFDLAEAGQQATAEFLVTPPKDPGRAELRAWAETGGVRTGEEVITIEYEHIPPQTLLAPAAAAAVRTDVLMPAKKIGYVMGAGDEIADALRQLGAEVVMLEDADLARGDLAKFDAIVTGVRAWNVRAGLRAAASRLWGYVENGGRVVVQYNVLEGGFLGGDPSLLKHIGPYPLKLSRDRVTVEEAPVRLLKPEHPLLTAPNRITAADFDGWIQERGLYFPGEWDPRYETVIETHDPGEKPLESGILFARHGRGTYVLTGISFFRQLPAGVSGAYRLFANLVSGGRVQRGGN